jgi:mannose-6-phosphate isomerase-like protein (cupin superfamily)
MAEAVRETVEGEGYAVGHIDGLGDEPGFRKVRRELGVTAFGVNVIVIPPGIEGRRHYHERQEELYFVHRGEIEMEFGDGASYLLGEGALARVDAQTVRVMRTAPDSDGAAVLVVGGEGGYVGRDGRPAGAGTDR